MSFGAPPTEDHPASSRGLATDGRECLVPAFAASNGRALPLPANAETIGRAWLEQRGHVRLERVEEAIRAGKIGFSVPDGTGLDIDGLGRAKLERGAWPYDPEDMIKEQRSRLVVRQGGRPANARFADAAMAFRRARTPENRGALCQAWNKAPAHHRTMLRRVETKDGSIQRALGLDEVRKR